MLCPTGGWLPTIVPPREAWGDMSTLTDALGACARWQQPARPSAQAPLRLRCTLDEPATSAEVERFWADRQLPSGLLEAWSVCREARLFEDADYGQWGLHLLAPSASATRTEEELAQRPEDYSAVDIVIAEFLGDQDLLVLDKQAGVLVALPLDQRSDWYRPASSMAEFFARYVAAGGDKYWEARR